MKKFNKFFRLSFKEKIIHLRVALILILIVTFLKLLPFSTFKKFFKNSLPSSDLAKLDLENNLLAIRRIAAIFNITCLPQALCMKYLMAADKTYKLKIGVNLKNNFSAHAWVENNSGIIIGDSFDFDYTPLWEWA